MRDILVPTDFSDCADAALAHALRVADRFGATLHLLHVVGDLDASWYELAGTEESTADPGAHIQSEAQERLHALAPDAPTYDVRTEVVQQLNMSVTNAIGEYLDQHPVDLVVMGTHGRRALGRLMLGSVSQDLLRQAPCPVLTVRDRDGAGGGTEVRDYETILAPIDFSEHSHDALRLAKEVADRFGAHLQLLFVAEARMVPTFSDTGIPAVSVVEMDPEMVDNAQAALEELNGSVGGPDVSSSYHVRKAEVSKGIVDFAEDEEVDLVVMATRGLSGLTRFMLGSNTERVVRAAPSPVLTIPAQRDSEEEES